MKNTTTHHFKWRGYQLTVEGHIDGHECDITNIDGITALDVLSEGLDDSTNNMLYEIEEAFVQSDIEYQNDYHGADTLYERD